MPDLHGIYIGVYKIEALPYNPDLSGGIAQLGERLHGMQEVSGSIPLTSTIITFQEVSQHLKTRLSAGFLLILSSQAV